MDSKKPMPPFSKKNMRTNLGEMLAKKMPMPSHPLVKGMMERRGKKK